jgi:hypothetical protein
MSATAATSRDVAPPLESLPPVRTIRADAIADATRLHALAKASEPLVIQGLIDAWPALAAGRHSFAALCSYLQPLDRGMPAAVMETPASVGGRFGYQDDLHEFTFSVRQVPLRDSLQRMLSDEGQESRSVIAVQMLPLTTHMPEFSRQNLMPLLPHVEPRLWIGGRVRTQIHHDRDHNLACVIAGRRRFVLFPPDELRNLYVGPIDNPPPLSVVDLDAPDFERFPRFATALSRAVVAHLNAGDALLMPRYWWHHVSSLEPMNAMVNYWWGDQKEGLGSPYDCFLNALLAFKELPEAERRYWQTMFEAHVFALSGDAMAHVPADLRGVLGKMDATTRGKLARKLRATLLKEG